MINSCVCSGCANIYPEDQPGKSTMRAKLDNCMWSPVSGACVFSRRQEGLLLSLASRTIRGRVHVTLKTRAMELTSPDEDVPGGSLSDCRRTRNFEGPHDCVYLGPQCGKICRRSGHCVSLTEPCMYGKLQKSLRCLHKHISMKILHILYRKHTTSLYNLHFFHFFFFFFWAKRCRSFKRELSLCLHG